MHKFAPLLLVLALVAFVATLGLGLFVYTRTMAAINAPAPAAAALPTRPPAATATRTPPPTATKTLTPTPTFTRTPTLTPTPTATWPATATPLPPVFPVIANPGFEDGYTNWGQSRLGLVVTQAPIPAHSGQGLVWLRDGERRWNGYRVSAIEQEITIPEGTEHAYLSLWFFFSTAEHVCNPDHWADALLLFVNSQNYGQLDICDKKSDGQWRQAHLPLDFAQWSGQTVLVRLALWLDLSGQSEIFLDDLSFEKE